LSKAFRITLEAARVNAGLSQEEAAKKAGVTRFTIANWENGKTRISNAQALGLANIYGIPLEHIFLPVEFPKSK